MRSVKAWFQTHDPAPSKLAWRVERWRLTPGFRTLVRVGLPVAFCIVIGAAWFGSAERRTALVDGWQEMKIAIQSRPEFQVSDIAVTGASDALADDVKAAVSQFLPVSSFVLDLEAVRASLLELPAVSDAMIRLRAGGLVEVSVVERVPVAVWRTYETVFAVDSTGTKVALLGGRRARTDLPLIVGTGADEAVPEALALVQTAEPLGKRLRGVVRIGERRWDVVLSAPDQRILLPAKGAVEALAAVIARDKTDPIFARDISDIDMRLVERPTLRMSEAATEDWRQLQALNNQAGQ